MVLRASNGRADAQKRIRIVLSVIVALAAALLAAPGQARAEAYVPAPLLEQATAEPAASFKVIVTAKQVGLLRKQGAALGTVKRELGIVGGLALALKGRQLTLLAKLPFVESITADAPVRPSGDVNVVWPVSIGVDRFWDEPLGDAPAIAVVDSGVEPGRIADFGSRVVASVDLNSSEDGEGDTNGHGTLVAGLAAGVGAHRGVADSAEIVSLDVIDAEGRASTSDVIAAANWILENHERYGIRVANFSLHSAAPNFALVDPLNVAVRRLWLSGIVVVAASGNAGPQRMLYAPGSDPFVITVGATDTLNTPGAGDDVNAPWSSYGYTGEGFAKPELAAPGRRLAGPIASGSTLTARHPDRLLEPGYMWMSGTSFSAPIVAGIAAQLLAKHPEWTPDQVKGALMVTANPLRDADPLSVGVGEVDARAAATLRTAPPNPNANLHAFVNGLEFDATKWLQTVLRDRSWSTATWTDATWTDATWSDAAWTTASWSDATWSDATWSDATWSDAMWTDATWSDATWSDATWSDATWSDATWSDATWSDASWSDATWSDATWSDATWSDATWSDATWSDATWSDATWSD